MMQPKSGTHPLLRLGPRHLPGSKASAKTTVRVTRSGPTDSPFIFESCPQTLVPPLRPPLHLPLRPQALIFPEDGRGTCLGVASRQFEVALSSVGVTKSGNWGGVRSRQGEREGKRACEDHLARRGMAGVGGGRSTHGHGAGPLLRSRRPYGPPARGQAAPAMRVASFANRHYFERPGVNSPTSTGRGHGK